MKQTDKKGFILIMIAGILWGSMVVFVRYMESLGFNSMQIVCVRMTVAAICFMSVLIIKEPDNFKKGLKDLPIFMATGFLSLLLFTWCYFTAIGMMDVSTAAILLYTSPIWVMLMSVIFLKERITKRKILALALAFSGCVMISGIAGGGMTLKGFLIGIGAGIGYGLYSIFGTIALRKHTTFTLTAFSFTFAAIGSWFFAKPTELLAIYQNGQTLFILGFTVILGVFSAFVPFLCYTLGLQRVPASKAAILATIEPMVATICGVVIFKEALTLVAILGIVCIMLAIAVLSEKKKQ